MVGSIILYAAFSGATVFLGALLSNYVEHHLKDGVVKEEGSYALMSFGSGIILSALALVLVPEGMEHLPVTPMTLSFLFGAVVFLLLDIYMAKKGGKVAALMAMLMDFVPESIALGALFAIDPKIAMLLAVFIGLQNFPESFLAYREMVLSGYKTQKALFLFFVLSFAGIIAALIGHFVLSGYPTITAYVMIFASGGILYLLVQDIIPDCKLERTYIPSMGAVLGFLVGMVGDKLI